MKRILLSLIVATGSFAMAHESDSPMGNSRIAPAKKAPSPEVAEATKHLPQTAVIIVDKETGKGRIAHLDGNVPKDVKPETIVDDLKFEDISLKAEVKQIAARDEADAASGAVAYRYVGRYPGVGIGFGGYRGGFYGGYRGGFYGGYRGYYGRGYGYGYGAYWRRPYYGGYGGYAGYGYYGDGTYGYSYNGCGNWNWDCRQYWPTYSYASVAVPYVAYATYDIGPSYVQYCQPWYYNRYW